MLVISTLGRLRQGDHHNIEASLGYVEEDPSHLDCRVKICLEKVNNIDSELFNCHLPHT